MAHSSIGTAFFFALSSITYWARLTPAPRRHSYCSQIHIFPPKLDIDPKLLQSRYRCPLRQEEPWMKIGFREQVSFPPNKPLHRHVQRSLCIQVHLVDIEHTVHAKHATGRETDIILEPAPSNDPDDPLNWSFRRKCLSTTCACVYTIVIGIASAAIYSVLQPISEDTNLTLGDLNAGTGYMVSRSWFIPWDRPYLTFSAQFLLFGWGCLVWQPLALRYGKRPVYLFSMLASLVRTIPLLTQASDIE